METSTQDRVGVLAVDDQPVFLEAARDVVAATQGFRWVAGVTCGEEALAVIDEDEPALVLLDVRMPGMDGFETAHRISERHPDVVVVLISVEESAAIDCCGGELGSGRTGAKTGVRSVDAPRSSGKRTSHLTSRRT